MANNATLLALAIEGLEEGNEAIIEAFESDSLLTFAEWKRKGFSVRKGEKSQFSCSLWKKLSKAEMEKQMEKLKALAKKEGKEKPKKPSSFVMTKCNFFLPHQVEAIKAKKAV